MSLPPIRLTKKQTHSHVSVAAYAVRYVVQPCTASLAKLSKAWGSEWRRLHRYWIDSQRSRPVSHKVLFTRLKTAARARAVSRPIVPLKIYGRQLFQTRNMNFKERLMVR